MSAKKVFFKSFMYSMLVIALLYMALLFIINNKPNTKEMNLNQEGVSILIPDVDDSKNILVVLNGYENRFFYLLNLNGIQNKVSLLSIQDTFYLTSIEKTIDESFNTAGIMQSSFDLSKEFKINIDYYLSIDYESVIQLSEDFNDVNIESIKENMPKEIQDLLLPNQEKIDINSLINIISKGENILATQEGTKYFNELLFFILRDNILEIEDAFSQSFKDNFSYIQTNINSIAIEKLKKINNFFSIEKTLFENDVIIENDENYIEKIDYLYNK